MAEIRIMKDYSHLVHNCIINKLEHDFVSRTITFFLDGGEEKGMMEVQFVGVINQDFKVIDSYNLLSGIEETDWSGLESEFPDLMNYYKHYKRISDENQKKIADRIAKCFSISSHTGLFGYIIAESIIFKKINPANKTYSA
ncbi:hypothetical protein [Pontibacter sp. H249]|uniref:hypothetical protein n=1 Tax=Pontibacter sp. H249 TaxID=3133420 RepID=UPI0030C20EEB